MLDAADDFLIQLLRKTVGLSTEQASGLRSWWETERSAGERLLDFLVRHQVAYPAALTLVEMLEDGAIHSLEASKFLRPQGVIRLQNLGHTTPPPKKNMAFLAEEKANKPEDKPLSLLALVQNQGPRTSRQAVDLLLPLVRWLEEAHGNGRVPNDLRPENWFVNSQGQLQLPQSEGTQESLPFASPDDEPPSLECLEDLAAMGRLVYWLVTGRLQGQSRETIPVSWAELIERTSGPLQKRFPSARALRLALEALERLEKQDTNQEEVGKTQAAMASTTAANVKLTTFQPGTQLGKCLLTERIGQGSFGQVFRAIHKSLGVSVAVKILNVHHQGPTSAGWEELKKEARLLARLNHAHIVRVLDFEDTAQPPYLVLEYVDGLNLGDLVQQTGCLQPIRALAILGQIVEALAAAHKLGIIHRDIKPANILITRDGTAKLADLGLAVTTEALQEANHAAGTALCIAPEQFREGGVDQRADFYSLGVTFYYAVTGSYPFQGKTPHELIEQHLHAQPVPPHERNAEVPANLSAFLLRLLAKDPAKRYQNCAEVQTALQPLLREATNPAGSTTNPDLQLATVNPTSSFWRRLFRRGS